MKLSNSLHFPLSYNHKFNFIIGLLALVLATSTTHAQRRKEAASRSVKQYTIKQFMDTTQITGSSFSPGEKSILFSSNKSGIFNVYTVPVTGGAARQLTTSTKESTYAVSYFPNDTRFIYTYDQGGNENSHLYLDVDGKEIDLTPGEKTRAEFLGWSHDKRFFFFSTNERDAHFFDIYEMSIADFKRTLLYQDNVGYQVGAISNDKKLIAFARLNTTIDADIYIYNVATKELKHITQHQGDINQRPQAFDTGSRYLYYLTDEGSEFQYIARYELSSGRKETVEKAPWDISFTYFSENGKYRVVGINEDARTKIKIYEAATSKPVSLPKLPAGDITALNISDSEKLMTFYVNGSRSPNDLYVYELATKKATKLTSSLNPEINPNDLAEAEVIHYKSFDGMDIPSILYKPHQASAQNKAPALVWVHGGPGGQTRTGYNAFMQYLVNHGYVILGVNNRGSSGYGKTFFAADDQKHGREPLWDCIEAKQYLASLGYVNEKKIGIIGGSYGGYMVLAALAFKPEEFAVGVDLFGVSNWLRTLESIPPYWESIRKGLYKELGNPETDEENLRAISPLFHADKISKPLIVLQGKNDPRVIKPESDEIVEAVKKNNGVVEYVVFDNEGHGFTKKVNEVRGYKTVRYFLDTYLNGLEKVAEENDVESIREEVKESSLSQNSMPPREQTSSQSEDKVVSPFPLKEDAQTKEFDSLPKLDQEARLTAKGPLFPQKYTMSNFSMRAFVRGNSPLIVDYTLQPNSTALITISVEGIEPFTLVLTEPGAPRKEELSSSFKEALPSGSAGERTVVTLLAASTEDFLSHPEQARKQRTVQLPASFGEELRVGKLSVQAFTNGPDERKPAYFRLYGLGMGKRAIGGSTGVTHPVKAMSNYAHSYGFAKPGDGEGSMAIDQILLNPMKVSTNLGEKVNYRIHSRSAFEKVMIIFHRIEEFENVSSSDGVHTKDLGPITENGWLQPRRCPCVWNGMNSGEASRGWHHLEVRAWLGLQGGDWVSAWSGPTRVYIN